MKKATVSLIILTLLLTMLFVTPASAADTADEPKAEQAIEYYGREALAECENATALLFAYDAITAGISESSERITVFNGTDKLSQDDFRTVIDAYRRDRADHFWMGNTYSVEYQRNADTDEVDTVTVFKPSYTISGDELDAAKQAVEAAVTEILSGIDDRIITDTAKLRYLHDTLAERITYADGTYAHSLYGALVLGESVCEGYAEALQYLLHRIGIRSFLAIGESVNPATGATEGHEWNYVELSGVWYHVDLTWDDQPIYTFHSYLGISDATVSLDHSIDEAAYALPTCDSDLQFHSHQMLSGYTVEEIAALLGEEKQAGVIVDDADSFVKWFKENIYGLARECGVVGTFTYSYTVLRNEVFVYILDCQHVSRTRIAAINPTCDRSGSLEYYLCDSCGKIFLTADGTEWVSPEDVRVAPLGHSYTAKIEYSAYLKQSYDCQTPSDFWHACERCNRSAGYDSSATDKFYTGTTLGDHLLSDEWVSNDDGTHHRECTVDGCDYTTERADCHGGEPTCTELAKCEVCGGGHGELKEHSFDTSTLGYMEKDGHAHACTECGAPDEVIPHAGKEGEYATETTPLICETCGYIITPALGHGANHTPAEEWLSDATGHWHRCTGCEGQKLESSPHIDEDENLHCDVCGREIPPQSDDTPDEGKSDPVFEFLGNLTRNQVIGTVVGICVVALLAAVLKIVFALMRRRW